MAAGADGLKDWGTDKPFVKITDWFIVAGTDCKRLCGIPIDHPNPHGLVSNVRVVQTSPIIDMNLDEGWVETENTNYILMGERLPV